MGRIEGWPDWYSSMVARIICHSHWVGYKRVCLEDKSFLQAPWAKESWPRSLKQFLSASSSICPWQRLISATKGHEVWEPWLPTATAWKKPWHMQGFPTVGWKGPTTLPLQTSLIDRICVGAMPHNGAANDLFRQGSVGGGPNIQLAADYAIQAKGTGATSL